tara:strand:- start:151 stop:345 length:195 start_codon:yes stop_codon:yes gene_type:complete
MNCYKIGDIMLYNNRENPRLTDTLVLIMEITGRYYRKVMFLKDGITTEACWIGYLLPIEETEIK